MGIRIKGAQLRNNSIPTEKFQNGTITADKILLNTIAEGNLDPTYRDAVIKRNGSVAFTGPVNAGSHLIINVSDPVDPGDIATLNYVTQLLATTQTDFAQNLNQKEAVKVATTGNITLSGAQTINGISITAGDRVLVKDQTNPALNGIYDAATGAWARSSDADTGAKLVGAYLIVLRGPVTSDRLFKQDSDDIILGTTPIVWTFIDDTSPVASYPTDADKEMVAYVTVSPEDVVAPGITYKPTLDGWVEVLINGIEYDLADGSKTGDLYFSADGGVTAKLIKDITSGDELHLGTTLGFTTDNTDRVSYLYKISPNSVADNLYIFTIVSQVVDESGNQLILG
jgi:hypothetical protein